MSRLRTGITKELSMLPMYRAEMAGRVDTVKRELAEMKDVVEA